MKIFVAGASGVIGRRLLPMLSDAGHEVTGMTRSPAKLDLLRRLGAEGVVCDAFDAPALRDAVAAARPEVVVHELTDIPKAIDPRRLDRQFETNDRLRREGTANLVAAALAAGARRVVAQSIAFAYRPGSGIRSESDPLFLDIEPPVRRLFGAVADLEQTVAQAKGIEGVVLRYGFLYGPGTATASDGSTAALASRRQLPIVGRGGGVWSFVHVDDAARATMLAAERGLPGVYNIVDDDPAPVREWLPAYAGALGAEPPRRVPRLLARVAAGRYTVYLMTELAGASNAKARRELGWEPTYPSWRQGFRAVTTGARGAS